MMNDALHVVPPEWRGLTCTRGDHRDRASLRRAWRVGLGDEELQRLAVGA